MFIVDHKSIEFRWNIDHNDFDDKKKIITKDKKKFLIFLFSEKKLIRPSDCEFKVRRQKYRASKRVASSFLFVIE